MGYSHHLIARLQEKSCCSKRGIRWSRVLSTPYHTWLQQTLQFQLRYRSQEQMGWHGMPPFPESLHTSHHTCPSPIYLPQSDDRDRKPLTYCSRRRNIRSPCDYLHSLPLPFAPYTLDDNVRHVLLTEFALNVFEAEERKFLQSCFVWDLPGVSTQIE